MKYQTLITATQCGHDPAMSLEFIFGMVQDAVTMEFDSMGCDNTTLKREYNAMWVFSKNRIRVYRRPKWNETVNVYSRVVRSGRLAAYFQTDVRSQSNELLIESMLECCIIDRDNFRFVRLEKVPFVPASEEADTSFDFFTLDAEYVYDFKVLSSITDMSHHMNNARALVPLLDSLSLIELDSLYSHSFEISIKYVSQAMYGTELSLYRGGKDDRFFFAYRNQDGADVDIGCIKII